MLCVTCKQTIFVEIYFTTTKDNLTKLNNKTYYSFTALAKLSEMVNYIHYDSVAVQWGLGLVLINIPRQISA